MEIEEARVEVRGLTRTYGSRLVMKDLSFQARQGEVFVIMGGSGSGKTTLLKHMISLKKPAEGSIPFGADEASLARGTTEYRQGGWTVGDYDGLVALLDSGLRVLSEELVTRLETIVGRYRASTLSTISRGVALSS